MEKAGLKLTIQKTKIMASDPITSWQIDGETMETVTDCFLGSKITADGDCSSEIKGCLLLGRKDTDVYSGLLDSEGEGGIIWENGIETCILSCKNRITSLYLTQDTTCLGLVHGGDPERCYAEGRGFMFGITCTTTFL